MRRPSPGREALLVVGEIGGQDTKVASRRFQGGVVSQMRPRLLGWCGVVLSLAAASLMISGSPAAGVAGYGDVG